ncbi:Phospholipid-transporting ATPase tat-1 [Nosema granulosis]|uniref:Phospholipid-transporting ATPase tat-1 n=1 Tax=Nosema granulosis TaxID=83296 RepID=A0A9P6KZZ8_9MICR|nr:Phospholipid-transporting ATPase tat-1 [Nosema granulosis]
MSKVKNRIVTSKYNKYTFFPLNAYHQWSKPSNMFFLLTLVLLAIPQISPFNPYTYLLAFCLVTGTSMIKDGVEDYRKHKQDDIINHKRSNIVEFSDGSFSLREINVEDLEVGNFVVIEDSTDIPADVIILRSKIMSKRGYVCKDFCYIDSSNLDGESNLKKKTAHYDVKCDKTRKNNDDIFKMFPICDCDKFFIQNVHSSQVIDTGDLFTKFDCRLKVKDEIVLCNEKNALLKGMKLKNTKSALAYVVAVGRDTKMGKSNVTTRKGHSLFEGEVSKLVYVIFMLYFLLLFVSSILGSLFLRKSTIEYLYLDKYLSSDALKQTGTNYILFSYLIPLSLFVTLEVSRMFHSAYVSNDSSLRKNGVSSVCNNSNVTEDLGMVEFLLCDKTGTLTKNNMVFKNVHISGQNRLEIQYTCLRKKYNQLFKERLEEDIKTMFIVALLCCNGVDFVNNSYEGVSQDEISILEGFRLNGIRLLEREEKFVILDVYGERVVVDIELTLDFTSSRQRMSMVVKIGDVYYLFTKGSDSKLLGKKHIKMPESQSTILYKLIEENSKYRTLIVGYKEMDNETVRIFKERFANITLENRYQQEEDIFNEYERDLVYLGTTFIEDELENEVESTLVALKNAGIRVWMITGDKKETAMSCAIDCGIIDSVDDTRVLIVEGDQFDNVDDDITRFESVVVYRATPHMKGKIAKKFRELKRNTLAVGDGNNDVPMLQTANIGVGILGKEGNQAGLCGDFAIPGFYCLRRLILVHGRYNFIRFSKVTLNAFYKNIYLITIQFLYGFYTGFSGKPVYNNYFLNYYNVFFTSLVPATIALFDKDIPEDEAFSKPTKYKRVRGYFSKKILALGTLYAIFEGSLVFFLVTGVFFIKDLVSYNGKLGGYSAMDNLFSIVVFSSVLLKQIRLVSFVTVYTHIAIVLSIVLCFVSLFLFQDTDFQGSMWILTSIPSFYFLFMMLFLVNYIIDIVLSKLFIMFLNLM